MMNKNLKCSFILALYSFIGWLLSTQLYGVAVSLLTPEAANVSNQISFLTVIRGLGAMLALASLLILLLTLFIHFHQPWYFGPYAPRAWFLWGLTAGFPFLLLSDLLSVIPWADWGQGDFSSLILLIFLFVQHRLVFRYFLKPDTERLAHSGSEDSMG